MILMLEIENYKMKKIQKIILITKPRIIQNFCFSFL